MRSSKKFRFTLLPTFLVLLGMMLVGCGGGTVPGTNVTPTAAAKAPASQQVFRSYIVDQDFPTLDPGVATDAESIEAVQAVFTGLVQLNDKLEVYPELASSYQKSSDGLTYTFTLRSGLKFSDGTPLTAQDAAYSIDRALSPEISKLNGVSLTYLGLIKDSEKRVGGSVKSLIGDSLIVQNPTTLVIKLNKPAAYFLEALTYPTAFVVEKKLIDQYGSKWTDHLSSGGGAGPFVLSADDHSTHADFTPNPNYWGPKPQLQKFSVIFYKDTKTLYEAYQANQVDETAIPSANYPQASQSKEFHKVPQLIIFYIAMNFLAKPFDNIKIRQAMSLAVNRDILNTAVFAGRETPSCHIVPEGMPGYNPSLTCPGGASTAGDVAKAKQLFQQGMQEEGLTVATLPTLKLTYATGSPDTENAITTLRQMWKTAFGIDIKPDPVQFSTYLTESSNTVGKSPAQGGLQFWFGGWSADYGDPQDWLTLQFDKGAPNNAYNYGQNQSADAATQQQTQTLMEQADVMQDPAARIQAYNKAEQQIVNDVGWLSLYQRPSTLLRKPYVIGIQPNAQDSIPPEDWANIYIAAH